MLDPTFRTYRRKNLSEMRSYMPNEELPESVSISDSDKKNGSPKIGDMIARNPENHDDQWLVSGEYFIQNFERHAG